MGRVRAKKTPVTAVSAPEPFDAADLLVFFYPIHYQISTTLEDIYGGGVLTRKQVAILQFILTESASGEPIPRKVIEQAMRRWFEMSTSAISKCLRAMARPPLEFVRIREDARSGRERVVDITPRGADFLGHTSARARDYLATMIKDIDPKLVANATAYFGQLTAAYERTPKPERACAVRPPYCDDDDFHEV